MKRLTFLLILLLGMVAPAVAQTTQAAETSLSLKLTTEEGKKQLQATLTDHGKPVEGATVHFLVARTFGALLIGKDQTLDDGAAQVPFPADLPGNATGELQVSAIVQAPAKYANISTQQTFGGAALAPPPEDFPRALWTPRAPLPLIVTIVVLVAAVWFVYGYVLSQLWALAKGR